MRRTLKNIMLIIFLTLSVMLNYNKVYADPGVSKGFADFDDETAEKQTQNLIKEQKQEQEKVKDSSNNNYIESLSIEGLELEPKFDKQIQEYTIKGEVTQSTIKINAILSDTNAKISKNGEITLDVNPIRLDVTAENGTVRTYIIKYNKQEKSEENKDEKKEENTVKEENVTENKVNSTTTNTEVTKAKKENADVKKTNDKKGDFNYLYIICGIIGIIVIIAIIGKYKRK